nr:unnamed protein product [Callosobruchus analis]
MLEIPTCPLEKVLKGALQRPDEMRICKCKQSAEGCSAELLVRNHRKLFETFRRLSYDGQSQYLYQAITLQEPKRRRVGVEVSRRHCTVKYKVDNIQVCKATICYIFSITPRRIQCLVDKIKSGANLTDQRGKHNNRPHKLKLTDVDKVCEHIRSFPQQESYFSRNASSKNCLSADLNISKMHRLFLKKYPDANVSLRSYHDIFHSKFNLRFGLPGSDMCSYCDKLFNKLSSTDDEDQRKKIERESTIHHMRAEAGYKSLREDTEIAKANPNYAVCCFMYRFKTSPFLSQSYTLVDLLSETVF